MGYPEGVMLICGRCDLRVVKVSQMSSNLTSAMILFPNLLRENKKKIPSARNMLKMLKVEMGKITSREM